MILLYAKSYKDKKIDKKNNISEPDANIDENKMKENIFEKFKNDNVKDDSYYSSNFK